MNRTVKIILITAICLIPAGLIITFLGIMAGGKLGWSMHVGDGRTGVVTSAVENVTGLDDFESLEIEVSSADVNIMRGDSYAIEYRTRKGEEPVIEQNGGKVTVRQPAKGIVMFDFGFTEGLDTYTVTVPEKSSGIDLMVKSSSGDIMVDRVNSSGSITSGSGDVLLNDIEGSSIDVTTSSGEIAGDKLKIADTEFVASSGDISMLRLFSDSVRCEASSGDIDIYDSTAPVLDCKTSSGDVTIGLNANANDYSYDLKASSGDIRVNNEEFKNSYEKDAGQNSRITVRTSSGDIEIDMNFK